MLYLTRKLIIILYRLSKASKDVYKKNLFPRTIRDSNYLVDSLIFSAELSDECVSKLTTIVRLWD